MKESHFWPTCARSLHPSSFELRWPSTPYFLKTQTWTTDQPSLCSTWRPPFFLVCCMFSLVDTHRYLKHVSLCKIVGSSKIYLRWLFFKSSRTKSEGRSLKTNQKQKTRTEGMSVYKIDYFWYGSRKKKVVLFYVSVSLENSSINLKIIYLYTSLPKKTTNEIASISKYEEQ